MRPSDQGPPTGERIALALAQASRDVEEIRARDLSAYGSDVPRTKTFAVGDPQAPIQSLLEVLARADLLGVDGRLKDEIRLISLGDHFDWGRRSDRLAATESALALLSWLASHPADQVTLILGNHDLARVCELAAFDYDHFLEAQSEADDAYDSGDPKRVAAFRRRHPGISDPEMLARDLATFSLAQRELVVRLLRSGRFRVAAPVSTDALCLHGAVTQDDLAGIGIPADRMADAAFVSETLNSALDREVERWAATFDESAIVTGLPPLELGALHQPADGETDGRGIFYQRPSHPLAARAELFIGPPRRRFDPRFLPLGLTQIVGHIRDKKARELLGAWTDHRRPEDGRIRHLVTDGRSVRYRFGLPDPSASTPRSAMIFADAGMNFVPAERYPLLDLTNGIEEI